MVGRMMWCALLVASVSLVAVRAARTNCEVLFHNPSGDVVVTGKPSDSQRAHFATDGRLAARLELNTTLSFSKEWPSVLLGAFVDISFAAPTSSLPDAGYLSVTPPIRVGGLVASAIGPKGFSDDEDKAIKAAVSEALSHVLSEVFGEDHVAALEFNTLAYHDPQSLSREGGLDVDLFGVTTDTAPAFGPSRALLWTPSGSNDALVASLRVASRSNCDMGSFFGEHNDASQVSQALSSRASALNVDGKWDRQTLHVTIHPDPDNKHTPLCSIVETALLSSDSGGRASVQADSEDPQVRDIISRTRVGAMDAHGNKVFSLRPWNFVSEEKYEAGPTVPSGSLTRATKNTGLHRRVFYNLRVSSEEPLETCSVALVQWLERASYVDLDELREQERSKELLFRAFANHIDVERPDSASMQHVFVVAAPVSEQDMSADRASLNTTVSFQFHLRYQAARCGNAGSGFKDGVDSPPDRSPGCYAPASLPAPEAYLHCASAPGWRRIALVADYDTAVSPVPVGTASHSGFVSAVTALSAVLGALLVNYTALQAETRWETKSE